MFMFGIGSIYLYQFREKIQDWMKTRRIRNRVRSWPVLPPAPETYEARMYT